MKKNPLLAILLCAAMLVPYTACTPFWEQTGFLDTPLDKLFQNAETPEGDISVPVTEDAYVLNGLSVGGDCADNNYGSAESLEVKGYSSGNTYQRIAYFKFDIGRIAASSFKNASLQVYASSVETTSESIALTLYSVPSDWSENSITYNNRPSEREKILTTGGSKGYISFDITQSLQNAVRAGKKTVAFAVENEGETPRKLVMDSREKTGGNAPCLLVSNADISFYTKLNYKGENPWKRAMQIVNEWIDRKKEIEETVGTKGSVVPAVRQQEYSLTVQAAKAQQTNGDNTRYTDYPTRTLDTLTDYVYNPTETAQYDEYGGYTGGKRYLATGYFYTEYIDGRWWTIDPLGYPYYHTGIVAVTQAELAAVRKVYPTTEAWAEGQTRFLKDELAFNSAGAWSSFADLLQADEPLSQTHILYFASEYGKKVNLNNTTGGSTTFVNGVMPLFDPDFTTFCNDRAKKLVKPYAREEAFFGWMLDNELEASVQMLDNFTRIDHTERTSAYSYATVWTFLYARLQKGNIQASDITEDLRKEFRAFLYDHYFATTVEAVQKYDTNHLVMGCRFLRACYEDEQVMKVAGYWNDVITFNYYNTWTPDLTVFARMHDWTGKPVMITEWYAKGMDACTEESGLTNQSGAGWTVPTQTDRGKFYQNFALALMECKYCIGFDWFKMWDNNPSNTAADSSNTNSNKGIYSIQYQPYTDLTDQMAYLNKNKYSLVSFFDCR